MKKTRTVSGTRSARSASGDGRGERTHARREAVGEDPRAPEARKKAEEARRASEARFRTLVQNLPDYAIFMLDARGFIVEWTEGAQRVKGYTAAEAIGQHLAIFYTPEDAAAGEPARELAQAAEEGRAERESWRVRKGGERFWCNEVATAVRDASGGLLGFTKISRDLSERKRMQDALRASEERHRLLIESARDYAIFMEDHAGNVVTWNPGAQRIFGYADAEMVGQNGAILFTAEDQEAGEPTKELLTALREGRAEDERWHLRKSGERFWASGVMAPLRDAGGALLGFVKVCRDLTERRQLDEQRAWILEREKAARHEAERAVMVRDEFLSVVSHELRTPLAAILLWSRLLRSGSVKEERKPRALEAIEQSALAQQQLVEDLLDMNRLLSGKLRLAVSHIEPTPVVLAAVETVRPMAQARGVTVEVSPDDGLNFILADPIRLQQIVWNLVNNAVKFTEAGGRVTVFLARSAGHFRIRVADTGVGIGADFLPHVFEMFRQEDASTTRAHGGLGLGLAITRQLVELHGGTIQAESAGVGHGATFTVDLPFASSHRTGDRPGWAISESDLGANFVPMPVLKGARVLLVEDETHTRTVIEWLLTQCGAEVTAVDSAAGALAAYEESLAGWRYDVLVLDIGMPQRNGYELLRDLRARQEARGDAPPTPALALTAYATTEDRQHALDAGFHAHMAKPAEPGVLVREVARLRSLGGSVNPA